MAQQRRNYGQYCGLAGALDVIGERWTLLIIRELLTGSCRYNELQGNLPGIGTNLLAERLKFLMETGLVRQRTLPGSKVKTYELTEQGEGLRETVLALARWGLGLLGAPRAEDVVRPRWGVLAVEAMVDPAAAGPDEVYEFHVDDDTFHVDVQDGEVKVRHGTPDTEPALVVTTDAVTFVEIGSGRLNPLEATLTRRLIMEGGEDAVLRCSRLLGLVG
ncbi:winged helix-turn-helix transcriptional regulator [Actinomadura sp. WMMB 499]|uniref:winged helix-turn-helix transcriptional regulator n=1 Tax=Actinomadura sp. WMMB 499 TaxID=1219491 RepID=UPI0012443F16|nr:winged helix-turn-helix transcriptional regulator [Actinomadura sp. WMMB 499]QFG22925.1 transcriptional regulator [Actinomadura sp. WMMB 499]